MNYKIIILLNIKKYSFSNSTNKCLESRGVLEVTPVPTGTKLISSDIVYSTPAKSKLPVGIYKVKRDGRADSVLIVKETADQLPPGRPPPPNPADSAPKAEPPVTASFKTPLQIFSSEVTRALKKKLPNLNNAQIQRIVIDKWSKMNNVEKQVYRNKAQLMALISAPSSSPNPNPPAAIPTLSSLLASAPPAGKVSLPPGWRRTLVQYKGETNEKRYEIVIHTPTGEKLRTKKELLEYIRINNITGVTGDVFDLRRSKVVPGSVPQLQPVVSRPETTVFRPNPAAKDAMSSSSNGLMKMVKMVVETPNGGKRETLVPAIPGANGTLKISLPRYL